jgi:hypothetical protein
MGFLQKIKSSIYDPDFYSKIKHQSLGSVLKYFFLLVLILTTLNVLVLSYELGVRVPQEIRNFINRTVDSFPPDLEVNVDNGQVTTTAEEPFFVPFPEDVNEAKSPDLNNILVIDTKTPYSATQFNQYKTLAWLTKDSLFYQNQDFEQRSLDLSKSDDFRINRPLIQGWINKFSPVLNLAGPILIVLTFMGLLIGLAFNLIYLLFLAILLFFLSSIFKWGLNYSASFKTAIYASTLAFILDFILFNTGLYTGFFGFPFLFTLTALCIATINLQNFNQKS